MPLRSLQRAWKKGGYIRRLSGLTLPPSILARGVDTFIASLQEIPASPTPSLESNSAPTTTDGSSIECSALSMRCGLIVSSERTCRGTRTDSSRLWSLHWSEWVTALRLEYSARKRLEPVTDESGYSSWPTASANQYDGELDTWEARRDRLKAKKINGNGMGPTLAIAIKQWPTIWACSGERSSGANRTELMNAWATPQAHERAQAPRKVDHGVQLANQVDAWSTPRATDAEKGGPNQKYGAGGVPLPAQAAQWGTPRTADGMSAPLVEGRAPKGRVEDQVANWPTPAARDFKSDHAQKTDLELYGSKGAPLSRVATCRFSHPDPATPDGPPSSSERRSLNPRFVEWMHGWPIGWTSSDPLAMELPLWLERMRGQLSRLVSNLQSENDGLMFR